MRKKTRGRKYKHVDNSTTPEFIKITLHIDDVMSTNKKYIGKGDFLSNRVRKNLKLIKAKKLKPEDQKNREGKIIGLDKKTKTVTTLKKNPKYKPKTKVFWVD